MSKRLFLLDGMALVYRAHFAMMRNPMRNSSGQNTSAVYGFINTLLEVLEKRSPSHVAIALDVSGPTVRHEMYSEYKAQRQETPEDIRFAVPQIERFAEAFQIPVIKKEGYEADDIIGTYAARASKQGFEVFMVTPDKDFSQLVSANVHILKPAKRGGESEVVDVAQVCEQWHITHPLQVIDVLGLWGDASDNIPGVKGIGEKTAKKLIQTYGSIEELYAHIDELRGKQKENLEQGHEQALLSQKLATIIQDVPIHTPLDEFEVQPYDKEKLALLCSEFEFNALGKRLLGNQFKAGRGHASTTEQMNLFDDSSAYSTNPSGLSTLEDKKVSYHYEKNPETIVAALLEQEAFCFDLETEGLDVKTTAIVGIAFSAEKEQGWFLPFPKDPDVVQSQLQKLAPLWESKALKVGHNLKFDLSVLRWHGVQVTGPFFDTMIAHYLIDADQRLQMDFLSERYLGYSPIPITRLIGDKKKPERSMREVDTELLTQYAVEDADITLQLWQVLAPKLVQSYQQKIFETIEMPLLPVLVEMEHTGIRLDESVLRTLSQTLDEKIRGHMEQVFEKAGQEFNLNSPKQLGDILFGTLKIVEKPKKTRTGQYATNEQILQSLADKHPIMEDILAYREATKLKSTYVDALPKTVCKTTGRIHTSFSQTAAITGRLASNNPNLQNIPIRTEMGRGIRRAFVPRNQDHVLLAADYSQIELRIMAALSEDAAMLEAFEQQVDIHAATAARVFGVNTADVTAEQRRKAKMVNFGIIYGISAFGLSQRLGASRSESASIIDTYFEQYPGVKTYMENTIKEAEEKGYVETITGRRREIKDIHSANKTIKAAAERVAINTPIQGTAADMIKIAMIRIQLALQQQSFRSTMLLQVHDELVFDMHKEEEDLKPLVEKAMRDALKLPVPIVVEMGTGSNWLEAH